MNDAIQTLVDIEHELPEVGQASRAGNSRAANEEYFAARVGQQEALGDCG
jgi:hypothetical protein